MPKNTKNDGAADSAEKTPRKRKTPEGVPFTPMTAKQAQQASVRARNLRKQIRAQILDAAVREGIDKIFIKALKSSDIDKMAIVEKAMKLIGLDYAGTEGILAQVEAKTAKPDGDEPVNTTIKFVLAKRPTEG